MDNNMDRYLGHMLDNRYELLEVIGSGGMAVVYRALCHRLNRYVAVKILKDEFAYDDDFREHFCAESQAVAMLSHPNIVSVYDFSRSLDCQYIVMELLEGITLKQYMQKKGGELSWKESLHFSTQIAKALEHAHGKGIIHRDIKPQNIMVVKDGSIKVADFGIAHLQSESTTEVGETVGSIHYISPEQARGEPVDSRSDIYSLGVVMYEMLTGTLPYDGDTVESVAVQHISSILTFPGDINPDIPQRLEEITLKAMNADINARYQSAEEIIDDLEDFRKSQSVTPIELPEESDELTKKEHRHGIKWFLTKRNLPEKEYKKAKKRAGRVSIFSGIALLSILILALTAFLWKFWIEDLFSDYQRIDIPNFVGQQSDDIVNDDSLKGKFSFIVNFVVDPESPEGCIIGQTPEAGRSVAISDKPTEIELNVSTGILMTKINNVENLEYREATIVLEKQGFKVITEIVASDTVTRDYVVNTKPAAGEELPAGSTVYVYVSGGPELKEVAMPNLVGKTQTAAINLLSENQIDVGSISKLSSEDYPQGTIIWQSIDAGEMVVQRTIVYLQVSTGPRPTPSPSPEVSEEAE